MTTKKKTSSEAAPPKDAARTSPATPTTKSPAKNDVNHLLLKSNLKQLRLPTMKAEFEQLAREAAQSNQTFEQYLLRLTELEVSARATNTLNSRIRQAQFPVQKDLDSYDFSALPSVNKQNSFVRHNHAFVEPGATTSWSGSSNKPPTAAGTGSGRMDLSARQRLPDRSAWHWEDASFDRIGTGRLS